MYIIGDSEHSERLFILNGYSGDEKAIIAIILYYMKVPVVYDYEEGDNKISR